VSHNVTETALQDNIRSLLGFYQSEVNKVAPGPGTALALKRAAFVQCGILDLLNLEAGDEAALGKAINNYSWLWTICTRIPLSADGAARAYYDALRELLDHVDNGYGTGVKASIPQSFFLALCTVVVMYKEKECTGKRTYLEVAVDCLEQV
jgi:hypothetical protein